MRRVVSAARPPQRFGSACALPPQQRLLALLKGKYSGMDVKDVPFSYLEWVSRAWTIHDEALRSEIMAKVEEDRKHHPPRVYKKEFIVRFGSVKAASATICEMSVEEAVSERGVALVDELTRMVESGDLSGEVSFLRLANYVASDDDITAAVTRLVQKAKSVNVASVMPDVWNPRAIRVLEAIAEKPSLFSLNIRLSPDNSDDNLNEVSNVLCNFAPVSGSFNIWGSSDQTVSHFLSTIAHQHALAKPMTKTKKLLVHTKKGQSPIDLLKQEYAEPLTAVVSGDFECTQELIGDFGLEALVVRPKAEE